MAEGPTNRQATFGWTDHDGPRRPPAAPPRALFAGMAIGLAAIFIGFMTTGTLCPEHREWVNGLAAAGVIGMMVTIVGLIRRSAAAPIVATAVCVIGIAIGLIDTVHSPQRGALIAVAFGLMTLASMVATAMMMRLWMWDRAVTRSLATARVDSMPVLPATPAPEPVEPAGDHDLTALG